MSFRFIWVLIILVIQIIIWLIWEFYRREKKIFTESSLEVESSLLRGFSKSRLNMKNRFIIFGIIILTLSSAGPQIGIRVRPIERKGVDLVIAIDTSISMDAEDVTPSRLAKAKFEIGNLIKNLNGDRVSIIVFAGSSHLYLPLTTDYEAALLFLNEIDTKMIPTQGTVLSSALNTAIEIFSEDSDKYKVMLIVSDGEDHDGQAIELAKKASNLNLIINTIGVGSKNGSLIPIKGLDKNNVEFKRNLKGELITSVLNENILKEIAKYGNGEYFWFSNSADSHFEIKKSIDNMEKKIISTHEFSEFEDRYQYFAFLSLFCFIIGFIYPTNSKEV